MKMSTRVSIALGVVLLDLAVFFLPLTALFLAYVLIYNPPWFRDFLNTLGSAEADCPRE
jgi:hypothetical protein